MKSIKSFSLPILLIALLFIGCTMQTENIKGAIQLSITEKTSKTLLPEINMNIETYDIYGTGPGSEIFEYIGIGVNEPVLTIEKLAFGDWSILVEGKNVDGTIIGRGTGSTRVTTNETSYVNITVTPLVGTGGLDLTVLWNSEDTDIPSVDGELIPFSGSTLPLDFTIIDGDTAVFSDNTISTGYHTAVIKLLDNGLLTMGAVEVVRIVYEETTYGTFEFYNINKPGGTIQVNITDEMDDPIDVSISGASRSITTEEAMTLTASVPADTGNVIYIWYVNGESVETGDSLTINDYDIGYYRIDVTAYTVDGKRAGSSSHQLTVVEHVPVAARDLRGRSITFSDVTINGVSTNIFTVAPSSEVTVGVTWISEYTSTYCPGCIQQYYIGVKDLVIDCMYSGNTSNTVSGTGSINFTSPSEPGLYPVQVASTLQFSCTLTSANIGGGAAGAIAYIYVDG